jgi:hypothetical protein
VINTIDLLRQVPLFRTLSLENLYEISSKISEEKFSDNAIIFHEGDDGNCLYIVKSGTVLILDHNEFEDEIVLAELHSGDYFGEIALITGEPRNATVKVSHESILLKLLKDDFQVLLNKNAAMYIPIAYVLSQRLKEGNQRRLKEELDRNQKYTPIGNLEDNSIIELMRYSEENSLTGKILIKSGSQLAVLNYERGDIQGVELDHKTADDFLDTILTWKVGNFKIEPRPFIIKKEKIQELEHDNKDKVTYEFYLNDLITVLNIISGNAIKIIGRTIVENFLKKIQKQMYKDYPQLYLFNVVSGGHVELYENMDSRSVKEEEILATAIWLKKFINECSRYEIKFETFDITYVTHTYYDVLKSNGFYDYYMTAD